MIKPQYVDQKDEVCKVLDLLKVKDRDVKDLSGGELQRIACAMVCIQAADIFMFDEPSSYLDDAIAIRALTRGPDKFVIVVEHDLSVLDYLSGGIRRRDHALLRAGEDQHISGWVRSH